MSVATQPASLQTKSTATGRMKALVYHGPGKRAWEETPRPAIQNTTDAIVRITTSTICGTDLHKTYYFCATGCKTKFDANPAQYTNSN